MSAPQPLPPAARAIIARASVAALMRSVARHDARRAAQQAEKEAET